MLTLIETTYGDTSRSTRVLESVEVMSISNLIVRDLQLADCPLSGKELLIKWYMIMQVRPIPLEKLVTHVTQAANAEYREDWDSLRREGIVVTVDLEPHQLLSRISDRM